MENSRILRIAILAKIFVLLISPSAGFTISAVPAEKSKRISPHSSSSLAYRCTALYSYAAAAIFCFCRSASIPPHREHRHPPIVRSACPRSFYKFALRRWCCYTHKWWQAVQIFFLKGVGAIILMRFSPFITLRPNRSLYLLKPATKAAFGLCI